MSSQQSPATLPPPGSHVPRGPSPWSEPAPWSRRRSLGAGCHRLVVRVGRARRAGAAWAVGLAQEARSAAGCAVEVPWVAASVGVAMVLVGGWLGLMLVPFLAG